MRNSLNFALSAVFKKEPYIKSTAPLSGLAGRLALGLILFFSLASAAGAEITLSAPDKVARGDAFAASVKSLEPVKDFNFFWRGRSYPVKARAVQNGGMEEYTAEILLPVPLDETAKNLRLGAGAGKGSPAAVHADISLYDRKRPVQKLTVDKKYVNPPAREKERIKNDREKVRRALERELPEQMWSLPFNRPVQGGVSSLFGMKRVFNGEPRSVHRGLDLRAASGTPIYACADGQVALADNLYYSGNAVYVNHGGGVFTAYLHMSEPKVKEGQMVKKGDLLGLAGATGRVTGPHLHLSLLVQGQSVDPEPLLAPRSPAAK